MANDVGTWSGVRREMEDSWELVRVLRSGTRAMRAAGGKFTPATKKEAKTRDRYAQRLARTVLFPIYDRTVRKLASLPFMKPPTISGELPEPLDRLLMNADRQGTSLSSFAQMIYEDAIDRGLGLFLVDNVPTAGLTLPEADAIDARPYFRRVHPDNLVGCRTRMRNGVEEVVELRIRNWYYEASPVGGGDVLADMVERWTPERVERWYRSGSEHDPDREQNAAREYLSGYRLGETIEHGFGRVPVVACYTKRIGTLHGEPPMEDLAWQNVAHWNSLSMQGEALHYCRSPILKVAGASSTVAEARPEVGPGSTFTDTSSDLDISFVEIAGTSLAARRRACERKEPFAFVLPVFVVSKPEEHVPKGAPALAAIRPESFVLHRSDPGATTNVLAGTVAGVSHFGDTMQYVVRTGDRTVIVLTPRANAVRLHVDDAVWATWSADDVYMFSAAQADLIMEEPATEEAE